MRVFRGDFYQSVLIVLGVIATILFGVFFYRELFPEYKIYQDDYIELEKFRATYSKQPIPPFTTGIKQIVMEKENKGPADIDRCISCHVALQFEHFSPTKLLRDINGEIRYDEKGIPLKTENENYVFLKLDEKVQELEKTDPSAAKKLASLKTAHVGEHIYDVTKVLKMHPLIGKETRPFEFHPLEEYGCVVCHNGNGRGLTTDKAHGPIFDGEYEAEFMGHKMEFLEKDLENDPLFSRVFNSKPSHALLFMTTPLFVGGLIEAKCIQCHKPTHDSLQSSMTSATFATKDIVNKANAIKQSFIEDLKAFRTLVRLKGLLETKQLNSVIAIIQNEENAPALSDKEREVLATIELTLQRFKTSNEALNFVNQEILALAGNNEKLITENQDNVDALLVQLQKEPSVLGAMATKARAFNLQQDIAKHALDVQTSFQQTLLDQSVINSMQSDIDQLTATYQNGKSLFISQGCYACHRIAGISRAGVGPELTKEGLKYPWYVKESIVWPQADLKTSTMPNMRLDHEEAEALTTFLLAQTGKRKSDSETSYKIEIQEWEAGKKSAFEKPVPPALLNDLHYSMTVFATEGCAACHRLKGFESNVGFAIEKEKPSFNALWEEREWFKKLFPEEVFGSQIVAVIDKHSSEIEERIQPGVHKDGLLDELEKSHPGLIESFYPNFKHAFRALKDDNKDLLKRVLMTYIEEYGLGRLIGPRPNWSGVFRSDEWLMEHFRNPSALVARSIMPVLPFDDTKFYALTKMLNVLGSHNNDHLKQIWKEFGFNPELAYQMLCSQCHGQYMQGNGPVSEWIYPVPKNLRNANFLRNLTKERAAESIIHGIKGTPMPPWGEIGAGKDVKEPVLTKEEAWQLVDWMYSSLPGGTVIRGHEEILKWNYTPEDVLKDLRKQDLEDLEKDAEKEKHARIDLQKEILYADLSLKVDAIFDVVPTTGHVEKNAYYIKKKFYTKTNLEKGRDLFDLNCAVCHGKDADGRGLRAETMVDAKPRMLTNLNWLDTRDDLRLLRSIKFGVPGTSMTPWGDQTSGLQRLQLVMYIRSLSDEGVLKEKLKEVLYTVFDTRINALEEERSKLGPGLDEAKKRYAELTQKEKALKSDSSVNTEELAQVLAAENKENDALHTLQKDDDKIERQIMTVKSDRLNFQNTGYMIISLMGNGPEFDDYLLILKGDESKEPFLIKALNDKVASLKKEIASSPENEETVAELKMRTTQIEKLINRIAYNLKEYKTHESNRIQ